jgi:nocturnin
MPKLKSPCLLYENNLGPDGSAIFYRKSKFIIETLCCEKITLTDKTHSQIFVILQLKHRETNNIITIVCVHLKSKEGYHELRNRQIKYILNSLSNHLKDTNIKNINDHPILICGDFNGENFEEFYQNHFNDKPFENCLLKDVYTSLNGEKRPTTIKIRNGEMIKRGIDYIFHNTTSTKLKLISYFDLPKIDDIYGLPNYQLPSDHLSLIADFKII